MSFRISAALLEKIEQQAESIGDSKTSVVIQALTHALECPYYKDLKSSSDFAADSDPQTVFAQLASQLQHGLKQLEFLLKAHMLTATQQRQLATLKQTMATFLLPEQATLPELHQNPLADVLQNLDASSVLGTSSEIYLARTFGQILATASDLIFVLDRKGRFTYLNPAGSWVFGLEPSQILGKTWQELGFLDNSSDSFVKQCEQAIKTGHLVNGEFHVVVSGQSRSYEYILSPLKTSGIEVSALVCIARDVTQRKMTELALRESEQKYRSLFESAHDSILIIDAETHQVLDANWSACKLLGYTRREILQLDIEAIETPFDSISRETLLRKLDFDGCVMYEHVYRCKDETELPVEVSSRVIEYDHRLAIQSFVRDITDRKQAEAEIQVLNAELGQRVLSQTTALRRTNAELMREIDNRQQIELALRESEQRYHALAEYSPVGIFRTDTQGRCIDLNQRCEQMIGYTREEALRAPWENRLHPDDREHVLQAWIDAIANHTSYKVACRLLQADGSYYWIVAEAQPEWGQDGMLRGYVHTITDVTPFQEEEMSKLGSRGDRTDSSEQTNLTDQISTAAAPSESQLANQDNCLHQHSKIRLHSIERSYRSIFENAPVGLFQRFPTGRYMRVNAALATIFGYDSPDQLIDAITDVEHQIYVDQHRWQELARQIQKQGSVKQAESQIYRKDGSILWVAEEICAVCNDQGRLLYFEGVVVDISYRKRVEDEWQKRIAQNASAYEFQSQIINQLPLGLCVYNTASHNPYVQFVSWNPALETMTGYTLNDMNQRGWYSLLHAAPGVLARLIDHDYEYQGDRSSCEEVWKITTASGVIRSVWVSIVYIDTESDVRYTVILFREKESNTVSRVVNELIGKSSIISSEIDISQSSNLSLLAFIANHLAATAYREIFHPDGTNSLLHIHYPDANQINSDYVDINWIRDANGCVSPS